MSRETPPNIVLVVFDDTGWSDFACFGSEIATPTIDRLATEGASYANFHVTPLCSPTRAALLTGRNPHRVGMGWLADLDLGSPGRRGRVDPNAAMLPRHLADAGYLSYLVGKWHLTPQSEIVPGGPYAEWPLARGFDRFYGFLEGCTDHYRPELVEDNHVLDVVGGDEDYHLTVDLVDRALRYVADHRTYNAERPFFLQLAFGATHAPFQAPGDYIRPYVDVFAKGWDRTREDRLQRQLELGLVPPGTELAPRPDDVPAWDDLSDDERTLATALQAAFAGFLTHTDEQLGRFLDGLERFAVREDTLVIVLSDNGAAHDGRDHGSVDVLSLWNGIDLPIERELRDLDDLLATGGRSQYPQGWAMAGNTPYPRYKQYVDAGGVRSPLIMSGPGVRPGEPRRQFAHAVDIMPTLLELAGVEPQPTVDGRSQLPIDGASFAATLDKPDAVAGRATQYFELAGVRAIWHEGWKAISVHQPGTPYEQDTWRLYHVDVDPSETRDLAAHEPQRLARMRGLLAELAVENQVEPLDDRLLAELLALADPVDAAHLRIFPEGSHLSSHTYIAGTRRLGAIRAELDTSKGWGEGVLLASGTPRSGYRLAVEQDHLVFEHDFLGEHVELRHDLGDPPGVVCRVGFDITGEGDQPERTIVLYREQQQLGSVTVPYTGRRMNFWGLDVGGPRHPDGRDTNPALVAVTMEFHDRMADTEMLMATE